MDNWRKFFTFHRLLPALAILVMLSVKATPQGQKKELGIFGTLAGLYKTYRLEHKRQRDQKAIFPLIRLYEQMLERLPAYQYQTLYPFIQHNLGHAYSDLPTGNPANNIERAISCYQEALRFYTPEAAPLKYAWVQESLGSAYFTLPTGDRASNLVQAITYFQEASRFWTPEVAPLDYARAQFNLGTVYDGLLTGDRASNLAQAITCYQEALRIRTPEAAPLDYAKYSRA